MKPCNSVPPLLSDLAKFFRLSLESLNRFFHEKKDFSIQLPHIGEVFVSQLDRHFQTLWQCQKSGKDRLIHIKINNDDYLLQVSNYRVAHFEKVNKTPQAQSIWQINVDILAAAAEQGGKVLLLALIRGDGFTVDGKKSAAGKFARRVHVSSDSLDLITRWFFPVSGIGITLWQGENSISTIFYGGKNARLKLSGFSRPDADINDFSRYFRHEHHLAFSFSIHPEYLRQCLLEEHDIISFLLSYGVCWSTSMPLEINDIIFNFPKLLEILPIAKTLQECRISKQTIVDLLRNYLENGWKYLKRSPVYLNIKDANQSLLLEINSEGIYESHGDMEITEDEIFIFDIEIMAALLSWSNENCLKLVSHFVDGILPAEISEKMVRTEATIMLWLTDKKNKPYKLFLYGSEQNLPGYWQGDLSMTLIEQDKNQIAYHQVYPDEPIHVTENNNQLFFHFLEQCLSFDIIKQNKNAYGAASLVSETSVWQNLSPGFRCRLTVGNLSGNSSLVINERTYQVTSGIICQSNNIGRIIKNKGLVKNAHCRIMTNSKMIDAVYSEPDSQSPDWWQQFIRKSGQGYIGFDGEKSLQDNTVSMQLTNNEAKINTTLNDGGKKWQFELLEAWASPLNKVGHYVVRIRSLIKWGKENGYALWEFPIFVPGAIDKIHSFPLKMEKKSKKIYISGKEKTYLKIAGPLSLSKKTFWKRIFH